MGASFVSQLQDVADSIDRLADEIRHETHDEDRLDRLQEYVVVLSQSIDDLCSAIRYATNNLLDDRYHPGLAGAIAEVAGANPARDERNASEKGTAAVVPSPTVDDLSGAQPTAAPEIPEAVQERVRGLVESLQQWGEQHVNVAAYGSVTEMQWWENVGNQVLGCNRRLQELRELAAANSADIQPLIDAAGGIPASMVIEEVPDLASEPAFPARNGSSHQQELFDAADFGSLPSFAAESTPDETAQPGTTKVESSIQSAKSTTKNRLVELLADKSLTAADKKSLVYEETESALRELEEALRAGKSQALMEYLAALSRFHNYSVRNIMLIAMQAPDATYVAGFNAWKKLGRTVKKGEKGIRILAPMAYRKKDAADDQEASEGDESTKPVVAGFKVVSVFDVTQTEGKELPELAEINGDPGRFLNCLKQLVASKQIKLTCEQLDGSTLGLSKDGAISIQQDLPAPEEFSVLVHELAHELLHKGERRKELKKKVKETEAEAVAFVVCTAIGLEQSTRSSDYIQLYQGDNDTLAASLTSIQQVSALILEHITAASNKTGA
jgi:hypothetical protein